MIRLILTFLAALHLPAVALAQVSPNVVAKTPSDFLPSQANFCSANGGASWVPCQAGRGALAPAQAVAASSRSTLPASTPTNIAAASATRVGLTVQIETALTANLYVCTTQAGSCSATNYDALIPSGAGAGTTYTFLFAPVTAIHAYSTASPVLIVNSWTAP